MNASPASSIVAPKDHAISLLRVISMLMIIGCHIADWLAIPALAMLLNVGVYTFLIISGILYAAKPISHPLAFIKQRWTKLCIPMYYLALFLAAYNMLNGNSEAIRSLPTYLLNLQGINFIACRFNPPLLAGLEHLWFLTAIMMCYFLLTAVKKIENTYRGKVRIPPAALIGLLGILDIVLAFTVKVQLHYFIAYLIGYFMGKRTNSISKARYGCITAAMLFAMVLRLAARKYFDGTILYGDIIVAATHITLAIWICRTVQFMSQAFPGLAKALAQHKGIVWADGISFYVYITHYMFLVGPFYISSLPCSVIGQLLCFGAGTLISALILQFVSTKTLGLLRR